MEYSKELRNLIATPHNTAIFSHRNPDGDAIGSSLAMQHYLEQHGHTCHVVFPSEFPEEFTFLPKSDKVLIWDLHDDECKEILPNKDFFIFLDFNAMSRIDKVAEYIQRLPAKRLLIDHHLFPDDIADFVFSNTAASSTCEMVMDFIKGIGDGQRITPKVGDCILTGIITDTGGFRHATSAKLFKDVAELIERGVDDTSLMDLIFNSNKEKNLRLLGHCLYNRMEFIPEYNTAYIWLSKKDYEDFNISRGDTEGIVNYLLTIRSVRLAVLIHNQPNVVKLSMRSKGDINVQEICKRHFNGGGHKNASGAHSYGSLKTTIQTFRDLLPLYKDELTK